MEYNNETIIITDPLFIIKDNNRPNFFKWSGLEGINPYTKLSDYTKTQVDAYLEYLKAYNKYDRQSNDWRICNYGKNMQALGLSASTFNTYCKEHIVYSTELPYEIIEAFAKIDADINQSYGDRYLSDTELELVEKTRKEKREKTEMPIEKVGTFYINSGLVAICKLSQILKYNPNFKNVVGFKIENFSGDITCERDQNNTPHIIGRGIVEGKEFNFFSE